MLFVKVLKSFFNFIILLLICKTNVFMVIFKTVIVQFFFVFLYKGSYFIGRTVISVLRTNIIVFNVMAIILL